jgi:predicted MFS family arabinose efflux permease
MIAWAGDFRAVFWFAVIPGVLSVLVLVFGVREPATGRQHSAPRRVIAWRTLLELGPAYWWVVVVGAIFTLARFSEAFLVLRAQQLGLADAYTPLVLVVMNVAYAASAYPVGRLADRLDRRSLLLTGLVLLVVSDLVLAAASGIALIAFGVVLWGLHMGMTQGLLATMVADAAPADWRGTAFGFFNLASGIAILVASVVAGALWDTLGAATTFYAGAAFALLALGVLALGRGHPSARPIGG